MLNICMLVKDRPRLTEQAIVSLIENTEIEYKLTIFDDYSAPETEALLSEYSGNNIQLLRSVDKCMGPGEARNSAIESARRWNQGDYLYLCDNDSMHTSGWDDSIIRAYRVAHAKYGFRVLGGYCHPYNRTNNEWALMEIAQWKLYLHEKYAVGHLSCLMTWDTFDKYGPFDASTTTNGSEDFSFCQKVRSDGFRVGSIWPSRVFNCGLTGSDGKPSPGSELIYDQEFPPGAIVQ